MVVFILNSLYRFLHSFMLVIIICKLIVTMINAIVAPAINNAISRNLNLKYENCLLNETWLSIPNRLVLFLERNMDIIAKRVTTKTDSDSWWAAKIWKGAELARKKASFYRTPEIKTPKDAASDHVALGVDLNLLYRISDRHQPSRSGSGPADEYAMLYASQAQTSHWRRQAALDRCLEQRINVHAANEIFSRPFGGRVWAALFDVHFRSPLFGLERYLYYLLILPGVLATTYIRIILCDCSLEVAILFSSTCMSRLLEV